MIADLIAALESREPSTEEMNEAFARSIGWRCWGDDLDKHRCWYFRDSDAVQMLPSFLWSLDTIWEAIPAGWSLANIMTRVRGQPFCVQLWSDAKLATQGSVRGFGPDPKRAMAAAILRIVEIGGG